MASQSHSSASQSSSQSQQQSPTSNLALNHRSAASNLKSPTTSMTNHFLTSIHPNDWSNSQVSLFLDSLSLSSYSSTFGQNDITGDALILLDEDTLKELGVESVGHRLNLLGAIYRLKERWGIQLEHGDWVPGSESILNFNASEPLSQFSVTHLLKERDERIRNLELEIWRLSDHLNRFAGDLSGFLKNNSKTDSTSTPTSLLPNTTFQPRISRPSLNSDSSNLGSLVYNPHSNSTFSSDGSQTSGSPRNLYSRGGGGGGLVSPTSNHFQHSSSYASRTTPVTASSGGNLSANSHGDFNGPQSASSFNSNIHGPSSTTTTPLSGNMNVNLNKDGSLISPPGSTISNQNQGQGGSNSATMRMDNNNNSNVINNNLPLNSPSGFSNGSNKTPTLGSISQAQTIPSPSLINNSNLNEDPPRNGESSSSSSKDPSNQSSSSTNATSSSTATTSSSSSSSSSNPYKSFRVTLDDPCHKVLPAALKKYKIVDDWRLYALFICYGNTERCLSYDEKPLLLFQKLKEAKMNPVFMLRHIRDVKSPLEIAEGKAKARKGDKDKDSSSGGKDTNSTAVDGKDKDENGNNRVKNAIAKLSSKDLKKEFENSASSSTSTNDSVSNASKDDQKEKKEEVESLKEEDIEDKDLISEESPKIMGPANQLPSADSIISSSTSTLPSLDNSSSTMEPSTSTSTSTRSYAISIYPYVSEREDEFDVGVGDTFVVLSKAKGWWVVQRDSKANGKGDVDLVGLSKDDVDRSGKAYKREIRSGWVPAGCLLETKIPLGNLTRKRNQSNFDDNGEEGKNIDGIMDNTLMSKSDSSSTVTAESIVEDGEVDQEGLHSKSKSISKISIPPSIITSTSTPGIMLMDYNSATRSSSSEKSSTESSTTTNSTANPDLPSSSTTTTTTNTSILNLKKEDKLRVFKRYNHWSYCVLENGNHDRGWVPSWYIGRSGRSSSGGGGGSGSGSGFKDKEKEKEKSSAVKDREKEKEDQKEKSGGGLENLEGKDKTIEIISNDTQANSSMEGSSSAKNQSEDGKEEKVAD